MKAIILAGGKGTRLQPLTLTTPKPLISVGNKTLIEQVFNIASRLGIKEFYISVSYLADKIMDYFGDGSDFGLKINYLIEESPMGTAGALILLKRQGEIFKEDFLTVNADNLFDLDAASWFDFHKENKSAATIALTEVEDPSQFGVADLDSHLIKEFVEKPKKEEAPSRFINSGYYLLSPEVFDYVDEQTDFLMFEKDIFPKLAKEKKLSGFKDEGLWFDTGTWERYEEVKSNWPY